MHGGGGAALRTHRSYLAISHRNIVLSRLARWEGLRSPSPARAIYTAAGTLAEGASTSGADVTGGTGDTLRPGPYEPLLMQDEQNVTPAASGVTGSDVSAGA